MTYSRGNINGSDFLCLLDCPVQTLDSQVM